MLDRSSVVALATWVPHPAGGRPSPRQHCCALSGVSHSSSNSSGTPPPKITTDHNCVTCLWRSTAKAADGPAKMTTTPLHSGLLSSPSSAFVSFAIALPGCAGTMQNTNNAWGKPWAFFTRGCTSYHTSRWNKKKTDPALKIKDLPRGTRPRFGDKLLGFRVGSFLRWQKSWNITFTHRTDHPIYCTVLYCTVLL